MSAIIEEAWQKQEAYFRGKEVLEGFLSLYAGSFKKKAFFFSFRWHMRYAWISVGGGEIPLYYIDYKGVQWAEKCVLLCKLLFGVVITDWWLPQTVILRTKKIKLHCAD